MNNKNPHVVHRYVPSVRKIAFALKIHSTSLALTLSAKTTRGPDRLFLTPRKGRRQGLTHSPSKAREIIEINAVVAHTRRALPTVAPPTLSPLSHAGFFSAITCCLSPIQQATSATEAGAAPSCPLLVLDRQWLLEEAPSCQAFAMPILPVPHEVGPLGSKDCMQHAMAIMPLILWYFFLF